jgi:hypothetical protein
MKDELILKKKRECFLLTGYWSVYLDVDELHESRGMAGRVN